MPAVGPAPSAWDIPAPTSGPSHLPERQNRDRGPSPHPRRRRLAPSRRPKHRLRGPSRHRPRRRHRGPSRAAVGPRDDRLRRRSRPCLDHSRPKATRLCLAHTPAPEAAEPPRTEAERTAPVAPPRKPAGSTVGSAPPRRPEAPPASPKSLSSWQPPTVTSSHSATSPRRIEASSRRSTRHVLPKPGPACPAAPASAQAWACRQGVQETGGPLPAPASPSET